MDGFGDRLLMFDNTETDSLELLRFYPSLTAIPGFEAALHERVRQVGRLPDHAFPLIVAVERLEGDGALALVSTHTPGKRLSSFLERPGPRRGLNPAFVSGVVTQVVQALTVLQSKGDDIAHGALTPDRVIVTAGGRVCVVEHVLGSALRQLNLSAAQLWREFGLVTAPDASSTVRLDARTDVFQLGVLTMEMLLGRRLSALELKGRLPDLLGQWAEAAARSQVASERLRLWLERALQISSDPYASAADAYADLRDMPPEPASAASAFDSLPAAEAGALTKRAPQPARQAPEQEAPMAHTEPRWPEPIAQDMRLPTAGPRWPESDGTVKLPPPVRPPAPPAAARTPAQPAAARASGRRTSFKAPMISPWIAAGLAAIAILEGGVIAALLIRQPAPVASNAVAAASTASSPTPAEASAAVPAATTSQASPTPSAPAQAPTRPDASAAIQQAASNQRSGGVRLITPIELSVLQGDRVLGSTADGPIVATAGTHQLDLINTALGFRVRRAVTFRAGAITTLEIPVPPGRVSVNAQPWAEVLIDNRPVGETPLANLSVPIGEHEIVFRHPDLGERRQTITVRADAPTRVTTSFDR